MIVVSRIDEAVAAFRSGKVVVFPTDTVWGVGVLAFDEPAIRVLYRLMRREPSKPTAVLVPGMETARVLGEFNEQALSLARRYWPGPLTLVVPAKPGVSPLVTGGSGRVGLRVPQGIFQRVLSQLGAGVVASSANVAGGREPVSFGDIDQIFLSSINVSLRPREDVPASGAASTVVDVSRPTISILRQGDIRL